MEIKRKDDKLSEADISKKKLEEMLKGLTDALKQQEESNKSLKS